MGWDGADSKGVVKAFLVGAGRKSTFRDLEAAFEGGSEAFSVVDETDSEAGRPEEAYVLTQIARGASPTERGRYTALKHELGVCETIIVEAAIVLDKLDICL